MLKGEATRERLLVDAAEGARTTEVYPSYSMLLSIYAGADMENFDCAMNSIIEQTVPPAEIVLVEDGPIPPALDKAVEDWERKAPCPLKVVSYSPNKGLAHALMVGVKECTYPLVARMDADDWSHPKRMELELEAMELNPKLDMVGSQIYEFETSLDKPTSHTDLPLMHEEIVAFSKKRDPFRHPTMLMKKKAILACGNYRPDYLYFEDWDLFNRMLANGCMAQNLPVELVAVRADEAFYERRGGFGYLKYVWKFKFEQLRCGYFSPMEFLISFVPHAAVCLVPNVVRAFVYNTFLRKSD